MKLLGVILSSAGLGSVGAALLAWRQADVTKKEVQTAVASGGTFKARLTGYWPFTAKASERKMEGGVNDRKGRRLHTLEEHQQDPKAHPYVAVSGDDAIFPYGQRIEIDVWPSVVFRVVDTGGHFRGAGKIYRVAGAEPLDICVQSSSTKVPKLANVKIVAGDHLDKKSKAIALDKFKGQTVVSGLVALAARDMWNE